jgi:hypothetical protein
MNKVVPMHGFGGGGALLNFNVVGGTAEPAYPRENIIWLDTDHKINGYSFSATQPENMTEGEVWFPIGAVSNVAFSATKKNPVMVYPLSAKQKIDGVLVDVTAKSYQNGEWVEWIPVGALCWYGDECVATTGGWTTRTWRRNSGAGTSGTTTLKKNSNNIEAIWASASGEHSAVLEVVNDVDLTNVNTIDVKYDLSHYPYHSGCIMAINRATTYWDQAAVKVDVVSGNNISASIDVSKLSGSYDIALGLHISAGQNISLKVYEVMRR